jgi:hypothetical protein
MSSPVGVSFVSGFNPRFVSERQQQNTITVPFRLTALSSLPMKKVHSPEFAPFSRAPAAPLLT